MPTNKALKLNSDFFQEEPLLIQAIKKEPKKALKIKKFVFSMSENVKTVSKGKNISWKPPRVVNDTGRVYIEYYFRVPYGLPPEIEAIHTEKRPGKWERFRTFCDINRIKDPGYTKHVLDTLEAWLKEGNDPFQHEIEHLKRLKAIEAAEEAAQKARITLNAATERFLAQYDEKGRSPMWVPLSLLKKHLVGTTPLSESRWYQPLEQITQDDIMEFLVDTKIAKGWSNTTYNDKVAKLVTFFKFCTDDLKSFPVSPMAGIKKLKKGDVVKLIPFEDDVLPDVKKKMLAYVPWGQHLHNWCEMIYYTCMRPDKELRNLQVKHIVWGRHNIDIPEEVGKGGRGRWIFMVPELEELLKSMGVKDSPPDYYLFGKEGVPGPEPVGLAFYSNIFRDNIREPNGLDERLTPYCFKHTRCLHLWQEGVPLSVIQQLCGHSKPSMTERYLSKGLGLALDRVRHDIRRKF